MQNSVERKLIALRKVPGKVNLTDIGTKILTAAEVGANFALMGMKYMRGTAKPPKKELSHLMAVQLEYMATATVDTVRSSLLA